MNSFFIVIFIIIILSPTCRAQDQMKNNYNNEKVTMEETCDSIYTVVEEMPQYKESNMALLQYINNEVSPILNDCIQQDSSLIYSSLYVVILTINKSGKIINADVTKPDLPDQCKNLIEKQFLAMPEWKPGKQNGKNVCTYFTIPVRIRLDIK